MAGIVGYGAYIPRNRIKVEEIAKVWGADAPSYKKGLMLEEKSVPSPDQDTITMAVEASKRALKRAGIDPREIGAVYVGSESHPYAVKPSGTVLAEALGATPEVHTADFEFACKAGTEAMFVALSLVQAGAVKYGLAVGADTSQGAPGDALEYSAAAGAAAFIFGKDHRHRRGARDLFLHDRHARISGGANTSTIPDTAAGSRATPPTSSTSWARPRASWTRPR